MSEKEKDTRINSFIQKLANLDAADQARLKRNAGRSLAEARGVNMLIFHLFPFGLTHAQEEMYFLVATLYPLAHNGGSGNLGVSLRNAQTASNRKGIDRRFEALLDAEDTQLPFRLRQTIHFLQSSRVNVNWNKLLEDLLHWSHPDHYVQQNWAREYFSKSMSNEN